jgi:formate hydrogenlyase subunit 3/multisubunit Na+/H+ antiporter MnhD subunit
MKSNKKRKFLHLILSSGNLLINSILILINLFLPNQEIFFNIYFSINQYFLMEFIFIFQVIFSIFMKYTSGEYQYTYLLDVFSLIIFLALIGFVISIDLILLMIFFFLALISIGISFYFGEFKKEFNLLKLYYISCCISIILLLFLSLFVYSYTGTTQIHSLVMSIKSTGLNITVSILIFLGIGLPCGLFPFTIYHLKDYFHESDFSHLILFMIFNYISVLGIIRLLVLLDTIKSFNIILILIISGLGLVIAIYHIILELFTSQDGFSYSIKKVLGYSLVCDSNLILMLFACYYLLPEAFTSDLLPALIYFSISITTIKLLITFSFLQVANRSFEDNIRFLGNFWKKYKIYGIILFLSGLLLIFPVGYIFLYHLFLNFGLVSIIINSFQSLVLTLTTVMLIIYLSIILIFISHFFIQIYISKNTSYLKRERIYSINNIFIYIIVIIIIIIIIGYTIIYLIDVRNYSNLIAIY